VASFGTELSQGWLSKAIGGGGSFRLQLSCKYFTQRTESPMKSNMKFAAPFKLDSGNLPESSCLESPVRDIIFPLIIPPSFFHCVFSLEKLSLRFFIVISRGSDNLSESCVFSLESRLHS